MLRENLKEKAKAKKKSAIIEKEKRNNLGVYPTLSAKKENRKGAKQEE